MLPGMAELRLGGKRSSAASRASERKAHDMPSADSLERMSRNVKPQARPSSAGAQRAVATKTIPGGAVPPQPKYGGGGGGGSVAPYSLGGSVGGAQTMAAPAPAPPMSEADWLAGDQSYARQMAALKAALDNFIADQGAQTTRYNTDFNEGIKQLGWMGRPGAEGTNDWESTGGNWNEQDLNTASGRAFNSQLNDFASRGILQSSLFGTARNDLQRSLNDQLGSVVTGRRNFLDDLTRQRTSYTQENENAGRSAREEALARMAAQIGL